MKTTTIRLPKSLWQYVAAHAEADGVSASQWIRDACIIRSTFRAGYSLGVHDAAHVRAEADAWRRSTAALPITPPTPPSTT